MWEGRWKRARTTEVARIDSRGSRGGMLWKTNSPVLETRDDGGESTTVAYKETKTRTVNTGVGGVHSTV
jgi:hypothetical protein